jgi:hypothetical protein
MVIWKLSVCAEGGAVIRSRRRRLLPQLRLYVGQAFQKPLPAVPVEAMPKNPSIIMGHL